MDSKKVQKLEREVLRRKPFSLIDDAARTIQIKLYQNKIKQRREIKELRVEIGQLPFICRSSFVKVWFLKRSTGNLMNEVTSSLLI